MRKRGVFSSIRRRFRRRVISKKERGTFLHRFFDGALNQMMVSFLNDNDLSDSDLDELQAILNEKREKKRR